jgi:two-component system chemotaxis response regulator CheB
VLLPDLAHRITVPIIVALHIPPTFSRYLADSLQNRCRPYRILEASHGDMIQPQTIYLSPGHIHLLIDADPQGKPFLQLSDLPPEDGCSPSVNKLFRSAATIYGGNALAIVLTGMSCDGTSGLRSLKEAGAFAIAQDESTSVVWGMPGSAVIAGLVDQVLPLDQIAAAVENRIRMVASSNPVRKAP